MLKNTQFNYKLGGIRGIFLAKWKIYLLLSFPFFPAIFLGMMGLASQTIFTYDQARDAFEALSITQGNTKILGPTTDIPGVHHGVLWYYLLASPYFISRGDPQLVFILFFILSLMTIPLVGAAAFTISRNMLVTYVAMLLYAYSPLFQVLSRWLSNPVYSIVVVPLLLLINWRYLHRPDNRTAGILGIMYGLLIQSDFAFGIFLFFLPISVLTFRTKIRLSHCWFFIVGLILATSSYLLAEIKFQGQSIRAISEFIVTSTHSSTPVKEVFLQSVGTIDRFLGYSIASQSFIFMLVAIGIGVGISVRRKAVNTKIVGFLLLWLCNIVIFQFFKSGIVHSAFVFAPSLMALILLCSYVLVRILPRSIMVLTVVLIISLQILTNLRWLETRYSPFLVQDQMYLSDEKKVIEYTYQETSGSPFTISTVTNPLYINTTWAYLYTYYGQRKYSYLPFFRGRDQAAYLGELPKGESPTKFMYLIKEPGPGIPPLYYEIAEEEANKYSIVKEVRTIGTFIVEKREYTSNKQ